MFHDDEPPVSLFSFQDIITSLTGIMIFFLLMLSLNILQTKTQSQKDSESHKELAQLREKNTLLKKQIDEIRNDIKTYSKRIALAQKKDETALLIEKHRLEKEIKKLKYQNGDFEKKIREEKKKYSRLGKQEKELKKGKDDLEKNLRQNQSIAEETAKKRDEISRLRKEIEKRRKRIDITVSSSISKIPILIECSIHKISVVNRNEDTKREFIREGVIIQETTKKVIDYLQLFDPSRYYFAFMVKPSFAQRIDDLIKDFHRAAGEKDKIDYGIEPILETESIVNE